MSGRAPTRQTPDIRILVSHFLRQVESGHIQTPTRSPLALHFDSRSQSLTEYPWPCDPDTGRRIPPSDLEAYRRTHTFKGPSCLCAFIDGTRYAESRIGIVESIEGTGNRSVLRGEYVAVCPRQRCGYYLCLERFYPLNGLKLKVYIKRATPLPVQELTYIAFAERGSRAGEGLSQVMTNALICGRGNRLTQVCTLEPRRMQLAVVEKLAIGIPEADFWEAFAQCIACKLVMFRECVMQHKCPGGSAERKRKRHAARPCTRRVQAQLEFSPGDVPETPSVLRSLRSSPIRSPSNSDWTPMSNAATPEVNIQDGGSTGEPDSGDETEIIPASDEVEAPLSSDFEFPSLLQVLESARTRTASP